MHYWRLEPSSWHASLEQLRDLGLPIVETYAPWQVHEIAPGRYDFGESREELDLGRFIDLAAQLDLLVFLRPGPHINAEMTYFGLPERIVYDSACQARSPRQLPVIQAFPPRMFPVPSYASKTFHEEAGRWFDALFEIVTPRMWPDGPVAMVQVDNEGSYYFRDGAYEQDYHPDAIALWRKFLERRYGTLRKVAEAHRQAYSVWADAGPPTKFAADSPETLVRHLDWVTFREDMIAGALGKLKKRLTKAGMKRAVTVHNFPLGDQGAAMSLPAVSDVVDLAGFDYYHARREHRAIKRRTLYLAGTSGLPYAPEMGVGAPAWFTPLANDDSLFTLLTALAYGLRGFNLYMAVDRDRWYGAPIDARGNPRLDAGVYKHLLSALHDVGFHRLSRRAEVALMLPREYGRLSKATSLLGFLSPTVLEAVTSSPTIACREDTFGFVGPIQVLWWKMVSRLAHALTIRGVPYVYVDGDARVERSAAAKVMLTPSFEICDPERWKRINQFADNGGAVIYGPAMPSLDLRANRTLFEVPKNSRRVLIDRDEDAVALVDELVERHALRQPFRVSPAPLECCVHEDTAGPRVLFVINPSKRALTAHVQAYDGGGASVHLEDVMNAERFGGSAMAIPVKGWTVRMFRITGIATEDAGSQEAVAS